MKNFLRLSLGIILLATTACADIVHVNDPAAATPSRQVPWDNTVVVNDGWEYLEQNLGTPAEAGAAGGWTKVSLPHTWNARDTLATARYRRDASWYRREFQFTEADLKDRLYLRFGAASKEAVVYVNGIRIAEHKGAYSAFVAELTRHVVPGVNIVLVRVTNKHHADLAPVSGDFNQYGGLYREVRLIRAPQVSFSRNFYAGPGVLVTSKKVSPEEADLSVKAVFDKSATADIAPAQAFSVETTLKAPDGAVVFQATQDNLLLASHAPIVTDIASGTIENPRLWSPETPHLYTLTAVLRDHTGKELDRVTVRHGFRWFEFTHDRGFFLNGQHYFLRGTNRHQDIRGLGNALPDTQHDADLRLIKETGFNFLRLAHYQQDDYVLQRCDELGLLVWEEIPIVNGITTTQAFADNSKSMLLEMIYQHYNHPAVILWGMGNEIWYDKKVGTPRHTAELQLIRELHTLIHQHDPVRKSVIVSGDINLASDVGVMDIPDVIGYNLYRGWYGGGYETLTARLNDLHAKNPDKPMILSEFGAGADTWIHTENPRRFDFSEEYMINFLESHLDQMDAKPLSWLSGYNWWVFADFGAAHRTDTNPHINNKGLVDFERQKKDGFYYVKARLTKDPVLYIQSPNWIERSGAAEKTYRVFSNMDVVEFFHNGKNLGAQKKDFKWPVSLVPGANTLFARGTNSNGAVREHRFTVNYNPRAGRYTVNAGESLNNTTPENAVDDNLKTRWESSSGAWLQIDLGRVSLVEGVSIDFANKRDKIFSLGIDTSMDGKTWQTVFDGKTPKNPSSPYLIPFKQVEARYVKITGNGSDKDKGNSWNEVSVKVSFEKQDKILYEKISDGN